MQPKGFAFTNKLIEWVKGYPIQAFFLMGIALCFGTMFPVVLIIPQEDTLGQILSFYLARLGVYSPVLAGMFIVRVIQPDRQRVPFVQRLLIFLPVWLIAEIIQVASIRVTAAPGTSTIALTILSLPAALLPAYVISSAYSGAESVKNMLATLIKPRGHIIFYLITLMAFPIIHVVGVGITNIQNGRAFLPQVSLGADLPITYFITFLSVLFFSGGINEESGWRGFAQKRMQSKYSPLVTNLILWIFLVIWHIPNDIIQYHDGGYLLVRFALYPFITILFGWVYNRTKGSILAPAIFHASMNSMNPLMEIFPMTTAGNILLIAFAVVVIFSDRMWQKLPFDHSAVHQAPKVDG